MNVTSFTGRYDWLSNFSAHDFSLDGNYYATNEHYYQAMKTLDDDEQKWIRSANSPGIAKRMGQKVTLRDDWDEIKDGIMLKGLRAKFEHHPYLKLALLETGDKRLIEGNYWGDTYWGECPLGKGQNKLGKLLMALREEFSGDNTIERVFGR